jgi:hypothetical protein
MFRIQEKSTIVLLPLPNQPKYNAGCSQRDRNQYIDKAIYMIESGMGPRSTAGLEARRRSCIYEISIQSIASGLIFLSNIFASR